MNESQSVGWTLGLPAVALAKAGGEGWIRTSVRLRGQIYSLLPLTTRPPLQQVQAGGPCGGAGRACQRALIRALSPLRCAPVAPQFDHPPDGPIVERVKGIEPSS